MSAPFPPVEEQLAVLRRGVEAIVPEDELAKKLAKSAETGKPLRVKYGIDPTGIDVHLGHSVPLRKLRQFQDLGHQAVLIIGDATALVGDPSGRDEARAKKLTAEEVAANARDYLAQVGRIIDLDKTEVRHNAEWFGPMGLADILGLCGKATVAQLLNRDDFKKRFEAETPIFLHECLYPLMQAHDSVVIEADVELGGTEQLFTFMLARDFQTAAGQPPQVSVMSPILVGTDGTRRMGKSLGNYIGLAEDAYAQTKKFMQLPDDVMRTYFTLLTDVAFEEVDALLAGHPKEAKLRLAAEVCTGYHGAEVAKEAGDRWQREIGGGGLPADIPEIAIPADAIVEGKIPPGTLLVAMKFCSSNGEARRLVQQGGMKLGEDKTPHTDFGTPVEVIDGLLVWAGKKKFARTKVE